MKLPIDAVRTELVAAAGQGPLVVSSPTGSGKSTQVPRWLPGPVLVVEPRRVACRSLAVRVAELEGVELGAEVGYHVRNQRRARADTRILFATPGIVLRTFDRIGQFATVVVDELHERSLEIDLLLALLKRSKPERLLAMSATLDGERVASYLGGQHLAAEGRMYPVDIRYVAEGDVLLPTAKQIVERVERAVGRARADDGDILAFLPGKAEIAACAEVLRSGELSVLPLHGGLTLEQQSKVFAPSKRRKVILSTNVAETSLTVPGVGVVIDSGLVRRTRYHNGRGYLTLSAVARDSADQRAGRAGRTGPGVCYRLFSEAARLEEVTPPAVHRESLVPFLMAAAGCGARLDTLDFLDPPKDYAVDAAREELTALGAIDDREQLTERGSEMFGLPLDAVHARLLVEAEKSGALDDAIDLVAVLSLRRPLFDRARPEDPEDDLRTGGCDAIAMIRAVRIGDPRQHGLSRFALREARAVAARLRQAYGVEAHRDSDAPVDRRRLAITAMSADPRCVYIARRRKRRVAWSNGGTELELARESAIGEAKDVEAIAVLDTIAIGLGAAGRETRVLVTCATPLKIDWLRSAGLGRPRAAQPRIQKGRVIAQIERVYAKRVLDVEEEIPTGAVAREAFAQLLLAGRLFRDAIKTTKRRLSDGALAHRLKLLEQAPPSLDAWLEERLMTLGVESGDDLALLSASDFEAEELSYEVARVLDDRYPRKVDLGDATYAAEYDLARRQVTLTIVRGRRDKPPPRSFLPRFEGFTVCVEAGGSMHTLRR